MFMVLDMELCEETGGTDRDEGRAIGVSPEESRETVERGLVQVVGYDEREAR